MNFELLKVRATSFLYEAGALVLVGVLGVLSSPEFAAVIMKHFGDTVMGSMILLVVMGIVKHVRNVVVLGKRRELAAQGESDQFYLI